MTTPPLSYDWFIATDGTWWAPVGEGSAPGTILFARGYGWPTEAAARAAAVKADLGTIDPLPRVLPSYNRARSTGHYRAPGRSWR